MFQAFLEMPVFFRYINQGPNPAPTYVAVRGSDLVGLLKFWCGKGMDEQDFGNPFRGSATVAC